MKLYVIYHPVNGYLKSKKYYTCSWTDDVEKSKKWSYKSHAKSCITQTQREALKQCEVRTIFYEQITETF